MREKLDIERARELVNGAFRYEERDGFNALLAELEAARKVVGAAEDASEMLGNLTTDQFRIGGDKPEREALRAALAAYRELTD